MAQITTLTFFKYDHVIARCWAFLMMQFAHHSLRKAEGCRFYKLMGSGRGMGFNPWPDWSVYSLLQVWENESKADRFFNEHSLMSRYDHRASERWTIYLKPVVVKGSWSGQQPFKPHPGLDPDNPRIAVLTRATIRIRRLISFWKYVPHSEKPLTRASGLLFTKGIGEVPVTQMATFSLWENTQALNDFAYESREHLGAIRRTRELDWYREEMFARFQPYRSSGTWQGKAMLPEIADA